MTSTTPTFSYTWLNEDQSSVARYSDDGAPSLGIPAVEANTDYQTFLAWCAEGNEPDPYVAPTVVDGITDLPTAKGIADESVRSAAYSILQPTDWVVVREAENGVSAPALITSYRAAVRESAAEKVSTINSSETLDSLKTYLRSDEFAAWPTAPN